MAAPKRVQVIESDGSSSDSDGDDGDLPPPLEDMSDSICFRKKFTERSAPKTKRSTAAAAAAAAIAGGAAQSKADTGVFAPHTNVTLHGLSAAQYNGVAGVVKGWVAESGRHVVRLASGKTLKVKPDNLKRSETFSGLGKGFFDQAKAGSKEESTGGGDGDDDGIEFIAPKKPHERPGELSEVQEAMAQAAPFLEQRKDEWCTPDLFSKLAKVPGMAEMMENPQFARALTELQANPAAAMKKYADVPQFGRFFKSFLAVMGDHLSELGDKEERERASGANGGGGGGVKGQGSSAGGAGLSASEIAKAAPGMDLEVAAVLAKPGVAEAMQDPRIQRLLAALRSNPSGGQRIAAEASRDPEVAGMLRALIAAGAISVQK